MLTSQRIFLSHINDPFDNSDCFQLLAFNTTPKPLMHLKYHSSHTTCNLFREPPPIIIGILTETSTPIELETGLIIIGHKKECLQTSSQYAMSHFL